MASESNLLSGMNTVTQELAALKSARIYPLEEERIEDEDNSSGLYTGRISQHNRQTQRNNS